MPITLAPDERASLEQAVRVLDLLASLQPPPSFGELRTFLEIAESPGINQAAVSRRLGMRGQTVHRYVLELSERGRTEGQPGKGLVEYSPVPPDDYRERPLKLTHTGRFLVGQLTHLIGR